MELNSEIPSIKLAGQGNRKVHILEVIGNAGCGGMETYIRNFIKFLPPSEFSVTCICPNESRFTATLRELGVEEVYITPIEDDPVWRSIQLTVEVARLHQVDVLHSHMPKAHVLAGLAGRLVNKPVVAAVHGMNVTSHELGITRAVGSHLITNCQEAYTQALAMGVSAGRVSLVRNGVDLQTYTPRLSSTKLRELIGLPSGVPLVGFVGRLAHEKGPDLFLRAAGYVHHLRPDVHFVLVGDGLMRDQLRDLCVQLRLEQQVHFAGWMNTTDVYPAIDILAHTSRSDGTSLVLLEAMACGRATVGIAVGGVPEIIENETTGLLVGQGDWEGIGRKIIQLLETPERIQEMGEEGRARVRQHFNLKTNFGQTADILSQIAFASCNGQSHSNGTTLTKEIDSRSTLKKLKG